jgi:hypothetical protein
MILGRRRKAIRQDSAKIAFIVHRSWQHLNALALVWCSKLLQPHSAPAKFRCQPTIPAPAMHVVHIGCVVTSKIKIFIGPNAGSFAGSVHNPVRLQTASNAFRATTMLVGSIQPRLTARAML